MRISELFLPLNLFLKTAKLPEQKDEPQGLFIKNRQNYLSRKAILKGFSTVIGKMIKEYHSSTFHYRIKIK